MQNVLLTIHIIACIALVIAIMLQRSEGGALGMGGGGTGGVISGRGAAGMLVKVTMGLAAVFFFTSVSMTWLNNQANTGPTTLERQIQQEGTTNPLGTGGLSSAPATTPEPAAPAAPAPVDALAPSATPPATTAPNPAPAAPPAENGGSND